MQPIEENSLETCERSNSLAKVASLLRQWGPRLLKSLQPLLTRESLVGQSGKATVVRPILKKFGIGQHLELGAETWAGPSEMNKIVLT